MKKLFARLMLWFAALSSSLDYSYAGDVPFQSTDYYYNGYEHNEVDYKELYESYIEDESAADNGCNLTRRTTKIGLGSQPKGPAGPYWIVSGQTEILDDESTEDVVLGCNSSENILIAPASCEILTDAKSSNHGTYIQLSMGGGSYIITLSDMDRWYCCLDRPDSEKQSDGHFQHTKNAQGVKLNAGEIIGLATDKTTISIQKVTNGKKTPISLHTYYYGD